MTTGRTTLTFRLLGELEVIAGGAAIPLGGAKQRMLLALLLVERGHAVSSDRLVDSLWAGTPPATAQKSVQVYVSGLRKALGEGRILTRGRAYELVVDADEVDVDVFDQLVREAAGTPPEAAAARLREALALVRGRPLAGVSLEPWAAPEVSRIEERILDATEECIAADLALGRVGAIVPELERLVDLHPYRERLLELLMLALYRSGRQAEALDAYRRGATRLRDELGLEPGRPLQQLEASILRQDAALDAPRRPEPDRAVAKRRRGWMLATAGAAAVLAAAAVATAIAMSRADSASLESLPPGVAIISAQDGSLVAHISTAEIPEPVEAIIGAGSFWVWNLQPFSMVQISPESGEILERVGSPFAGDADFYSVDGGGLWFTSPRELVRVDAVTGQEVDRFRLTSSNHRLGLWAPARCGDAVWVANYGEDALLRVDPDTGRISARIPMPEPLGVACGGAGDVWVSSGVAGVRRVDPRRNAIAATADTPRSAFIAYGDGFAWTSSETDGSVYKIDRKGRVVAVYETGDGAHQLSFGGGRLWVANQDSGTITGIDAATGATTTYAFGHPVESVAALGSKLLVELLPGLTFEDRISALEGDVGRLIVPLYTFDPPDPALAWNPWLFMVERATCAGLVSQAPNGEPVVADLAADLPKVSGGRRVYTFTLRPDVRFAPPSNARVTAEDVRASIERALSSRLASDQPGIRFLGDVLGAKALHRGEALHARGIRANGDTIAFTLARPSPTFLERLALPFFCTMPADTPAVHGGLPMVPAPSAGPYYVSDHFNGEYLILKRNPNYRGPRPAHLDAVAFREGISPEHSVERVESGAWDGAILDDPLLAPGSVVARRAAAKDGLRTEELRERSPAFTRAVAIHALFGARVGCDAIEGVLDLASLCVRGP